MYEKKVDGKEVSLIARRYFEEVLKTPYLYFETITVNFDKENNIWKLEIEVKPLYSTEKKKYKFEISSNGDVNNVEQISNTA